MQHSRGRPTTSKIIVFEILVAFVVNPGKLSTDHRLPLIPGRLHESCPRLYITQN